MMSYEKNNREKLNQIIDTLSDLSLKDRLEVIANVFIIYGVAEMSEYLELPESVTPETAVDLVIDDVKTNGNTIGNTLAMQGIQILSWLQE